MSTDEKIRQGEPDVRMRFLALPSAINLMGKVHGGAVMKWIDEAAYACAVGWCRRMCVTVYVGGIRFYKPIHIGDLVEVYAKLIHTGNTSMHMAVDVSACDLKDGVFTRTTHCVIVFVAINDRGEPIPVPKWTPRSDEEKEMQNYAVRLMDMRKGIEEEMQRH